MEQLIKDIETALPEGWNWLLRKSVDQDNGAYFANIYHFSNDEYQTNKAWAEDPQKALSVAFARFKESRQ